MRARVVYALFLVLLLGMVAVVASATSWAYGLRHAGEVESIEVRVGGHTDLIAEGDARWFDYEQRALRTLWGIHAIHKEFVTPEALETMRQRSEYVRVTLPPEHPLALPHYEGDVAFTDAYFLVSERPSNPGGRVVLCTIQEGQTQGCGVYATHSPFRDVPGAHDLPPAEASAANHTAA